MDTVASIIVDPARIRQARGRRRAAEVARRIGMSRQRLCEIEKGRQEPSVPQALALAREYGVPVEFFVSISA